MSDGSDAEPDDLADHKEGGEAGTEADAAAVGVEATLEAAGGSGSCGGMAAAAAVDKKFVQRVSVPVFGSKTLKASEHKNLAAAGTAATAMQDFSQLDTLVPLPDSW